MIIIDDDGVMRKVVSVSVLKDIKTEIDKLARGEAFVRKNAVHQIIDKYIESEVKKCQI